MRIQLDHPYSIEEIAKITGGRTEGRAQSATHLTTDSREVMPGDLFVALRGEHADGNLYLDDAVARGASILLTEREEEFYQLVLRH